MPIIPLNRSIEIYFNSVKEVRLIKAGKKNTKAIIFFIKLISIGLYSSCKRYLSSKNPVPVFSFSFPLM